ncbi:MAG: hypothetical protein JW882_09730 [Deltaproteobacteria bacterium]|nr:hypothetical protein [Deltaproteobacteria bacterium]
MELINNIKMYGRFLLGLRSYLRHTISLEEAQAIVKRRMTEREGNFLRLVEKGIFGYPSSPYLPLLKMAGCEMGDIRNMVKSKGLENTLLALHEAGVYITFEEFKGRKPIIREGKTFYVKDHDFDNPYLHYCYRVESGGTTGAGIRVGTDLNHLADRAPNLILAYDANGVLHMPTAIWFGILPDPSGINTILTAVRFGNVPLKWFTPVVSSDLRPSLKYRLATKYFITLGRMFGLSIPRPEPVRLNQAAIIARWASDTVKAHGSCFIATSVSTAIRISLASHEEGIDLTGVIFQVGGEALTESKQREIQRTGARCFPSYFFSEAGVVGMSCARPADSNDLHFFKDSMALIQYSRQVPGSEASVDAFCFTTLLPTAPKLMLNVEIDDYGIVENRSCGCPLEAYGFTEHLRDIRSFSKLTGEGVTLIGSEMLHILEDVLPASFGGSALDYQLIEEEDETGFTRLSLLISPKIDINNETAVIKVINESLSLSSPSADFARSIWTQAGTLRIRRIEPILTARGKLMPLHLIGRSMPDSRNSKE